jgi:hypothetical protein
METATLAELGTAGPAADHGTVPADPFVRADASLGRFGSALAIDHLLFTLEEQRAPSRAVCSYLKTVEQLGLFD